MTHDQKQIVFHENDPFLNLHVGDGTTTLSFMSKVRDEMLSRGVINCYAVCRYSETHCLKIHRIPVFFTDRVDGDYMRLFRYQAKEDRYVEFFKMHTGELYETIYK